MDASAFHDLIQGRTRGLRAAALRTGLHAASWGYGLAVAGRNLGYDRGWLRSHRAEIPVVAIGNLTLGGTGKTPMVEWVARFLRERGLRVVLGSRGYGSAEGRNDEALVLEENLPDCPHLQGADRAALARIAREELEGQILVLDDAFQHRRLRRDLDLVLLDALDPFGGGRLFPRGLLREPVRSLRRADLVVLSRADLIPEPERTAIRERVRRAGGRTLPWVEARHAPRAARDCDGECLELGDLPARRAVAFCGIGNPEGFRRTLDSLGVIPADFRVFPDHHPYTRKDEVDLAAWARQRGAEVALTTQKDSVKLRIPALGPARLLAIEIGLEPLAGAEALADALTRVAATAAD